MSRPRRSVRYGAATLEVPDSPFPLDPLPLPARAAESSAPALSEILERPLGTAALAKVVRGAGSVLVVVSDATRATGTRHFLPELVEHIRAAGPRSLSFIVASGIHRAPTAAEIESILGPELSRAHTVLRHDPDDPARLVALGRTASGTPVRVNRSLREHERVVVTGGAGFHYYAGFSGGRKGIVPGLAARETVVRNHLRALTARGARAPRARAGCLDGNPVHRDMAQGAALVAPDFLLNTVLDERGMLERVFAGDWRRAHAAACRHLRATRVVRVAARRLVVVSAGGAPADLNLIQAHKAFETAVACVRPGGVVVLVARCPEGAGHPEFLPWFRFGSDAEHVQELRRNFQVYGQTALSWLRKARTHRLILVSELPGSLVRTLGAEPARDLPEALRLARRRLPAGTPGWLVGQGSKVLIEQGTP